MEVDTGNRSGFLARRCTATQRLIILGDTALNTSVVFSSLVLSLLLLLVLNTQQVFASPATKSGGSTVKKAEIAPEDLLVVQLKQGADKDDFNSAVKDINGAVVNTISMGNIEFQIVAAEHGKAAQALQSLSGNSDVASAEFNHIYHVLSTPNDPQFAAQWDLNFMKYSQARNNGAGGGAPTFIYICDTGLQPVGFELGQIAKQYNMSDPIKPTRDEEKPFDGFGHGTAVATVACSTDNLLGFAGQTNFEGNRTQIVMCRVTQFGQGSTGLVNLISACQFCWGRMVSGSMPRGPVNMSFGSSAGNSLKSSPAIQQVAAGLRQVGSVLVLASGNDGGFDPSPELYARRVGAIQQDGTLAPFSDFGNFVTAAPGVQVPVYIPYVYILPFFDDGTSFAAPRWCGTICMCLGAMSNKDASVADHIVFDTATVTSQGQRVPNMAAALQEAQKH